jgi:hypothetical protein
LCANCGAFDSLTWRQPARAPGKALLAPKPENAPVASIEPLAGPPPAAPAAVRRAAAPQEDEAGGAPVDAARLVN